MRFSALRPLLELEMTSMIRLEFRTQNACPFTPIDSEVDLVSAFYTCNEIQQACLLVRIGLDDELTQQLQIYEQKRLARLRALSSPKVSPKRRRGRNIFGGGNKDSPKAAVATAASSKEGKENSSGMLKLQAAGPDDQEPRQSWGLHPFSAQALQEQEEKQASDNLHKLSF